MPGTSGHLSSLSAILSPSLSGQPLLSTGPASFGHASAGSRMPSLSLSRSGQPSVSSNLSRSSLVVSGVPVVHASHGGAGTSLPALSFVGNSGQPGVQSSTPS